MNVDFPPIFGPARQWGQHIETLGYEISLLMIWNSLLSVAVTIRFKHLNTDMPLRTFDHLDIVRNEANVLLNLEARMPCILEHHITAAWLG